MGAVEGVGAAEEVGPAEVTGPVEEVVLIVGVGSARLTVVDAVVVIVVAAGFVVEVVISYNHFYLFCHNHFL